MRLTGTLLALLLLAISCVRSITPPPAEEATLRVKFYNKTAAALDSVVIGDTFVGSIAPDSSSGYVAFKYFRFDSGNSREPVQAYLAGKKISTIRSSRCATEWSALKEGELEFAVIAVAFGETTELRLERLK